MQNIIIINCYIATNIKNLRLLMTVIIWNVLRHKITNKLAMDIYIYIALKGRTGHNYLEK